MKAGCAVVLLLMLSSLQAGAVEELGWREANHRSAQVIKEKGYTAQAADLARAAFDLYATQSPHYDARTHAQLLLNAVDARVRANGVLKGLAELDGGVELIAQKSGTEDSLFLDLWREGIRLSAQSAEGEGFADGYYKRAEALALRLWGELDPRVAELRMTMAKDMRKLKGYEWTTAKYLDLREQAARVGEESVPVLRIDIDLAVLDVEFRKFTAAIPIYRSVIERIGMRNDPDRQLLLQSTYAQLEIACEELHDKECASDASKARVKAAVPEVQELIPLVRVAPQYPRGAIRENVEGWVVLLVKIDAVGEVLEATVFDSSPPGRFEKAALEAVRKWKFKPRVVDGKPVGVTGSQRFTFEMRK